MKQKTDVDELLDWMEQVIDVRDDLHHEEQNCNYRYAEMLKQEKYLPAKQMLKQAFKEAVEEVVEDSLREQNSYVRSLLEIAIDREVHKVLKSKFH